MFKPYVLRSESKHVYHRSPAGYGFMRDTAATMLLSGTDNYTDVMVFLILKASSQAYECWRPEGDWWLSVPL
jgi:hypothetical protein